MTEPARSSGMRDALLQRVRFHKVLMPVDFSPASREALRMAVEMVSDAGELVLVHIWQPMAYGVWGIEALPATAASEVLQDASDELVYWQHEAQAAGVARVTTSVRTGSPWHEIVEILRADPAFDLVVLGTHGRAGLSHVLVGSVAEKVLRHAPCAAVVVRMSGRSGARFAGSR